MRIHKTRECTDIWIGDADVAIEAYWRSISASIVSTSIQRSTYAHIGSYVPIIVWPDEPKRVADIFMDSVGKPLLGLLEVPVDGAWRELVRAGEWPFNLLRPGHGVGQNHSKRNDNGKGPVPLDQIKRDANAVINEIGQCNLTLSFLQTVYVLAKATKGCMEGSQEVIDVPFVPGTPAQILTEADRRFSESGLESAQLYLRLQLQLVNGELLGSQNSHLLQRSP